MLGHSDVVLGSLLAALVGTHGPVVAQPAGVDSLDFIRVTGVSPSVFSRPTLANEHVVGQVHLDEEYPLLGEIETNLPGPFYRILVRDRPSWIYSSSARRIRVHASMIAPVRTAEIQRAARLPEQWVRSKLEAMLVTYEVERESLEATYDLNDLPTLVLSGSDPLRFDYADNRFVVDLEMRGGDGFLRLPNADRFLFQALFAVVFEELSCAEACEIVLKRDDNNRNTTIAISRSDWENSEDLSIGSFWNLVDKDNAGMLWDMPSRTR